jgi:hypothetical protein
LNHRVVNTATQHRNNAEPTQPQPSSTAIHRGATEYSDGTEASVSSRHSVASETHSQTTSQVSRQETSTVSSTDSAVDEESVADMSNCPSPTKKKPRSFPVTEETTIDDSDDENSIVDNPPRIRTTRHSMVSTNLGTRFDSVVEQDSAPSLRIGTTSMPPNSPTATDTAHHTQEAPLDPQYTETGLAGADKTRVAIVGTKRGPS